VKLTFLLEVDASKEILASCTARLEYFGHFPSNTFDRALLSQDIVEQETRDQRRDDGVCLPGTVVDALVENFSPLRSKASDVERFQFVIRIFDKRAWEFVDLPYVGNKFFNSLFQLPLKLSHSPFDRIDRETQ
jgi:hypothetical protein